MSAFANPKVMTPVPTEVKPLNLDFLTICTEVPLLAQFVHFCKRVNKASNKPDNVDAITETALASFFLLTRTPIERFDELDLSELVKKTNSKIAIATKAQHAIQAWQTRINEELVELEALMLNTKTKLATACDVTIKDITDMKIKVTSTYDSAINEVSGVSNQIASDANMLGDDFTTTYQQSKPVEDNYNKTFYEEGVEKESAFAEIHCLTTQNPIIRNEEPAPKDNISMYYGLNGIELEPDETLRTLLTEEAAKTNKPTVVAQQPPTPLKPVEMRSDVVNELQTKADEEPLSTAAKNKNDDKNRKRRPNAKKI